MVQLKYRLFGSPIQLFFLPQRLLSYSPIFHCSPLIFNINFPCLPTRLPLPVGDPEFRNGGLLKKVTDAHQCFLLFALGVSNYK